MNLKLKICGMRDPENIQEVSDLLPDYMGFIFFKDSPRWVGENFVMPQLPKSISTVAVFVDEPVDYMIDIVNRYQFRFVQLHGNESVATCNELKQQGISIIKVFSVHNEFDFSVANPYKPFVDYFLFDTKGKYHGGNAQVFNWKILKNYDQQTPFFLSGGLSIDNLKNLSDLNDMNIYALDLNSGVEMHPGMKSISKVKSIQDALYSHLINPNS